MTNTRPPLGELTKGQKVVIRRSPNDSRSREPGNRYIPATVEKVARVWVDLIEARPEDAPAWWFATKWRMRMDTQDEGTQWSGSNASFVTMNQHAWHETQDWARGVLADHGVRLDRPSRWSGREAELAQLLAEAL